MMVTSNLSSANPTRRLSSENIIAALEVGCLSIRAEFWAKAAIIFSKVAYAKQALAQTADLVVSCRRMGCSASSRDELEYHIRGLYEQLGNELSASNIPRRQKQAVDEILFDGYGDEPATPYLPRALANWATVGVTGLWGEFRANCRAPIPLECQQALSIGMHIEIALHPTNLGNFLFPLEEFGIRIPATLTDKAGRGIQPGWLFSAAGIMMPSIDVDLQNAMVDPLWKELVVQRAGELGVDCLFEPCPERLGEAVEAATAAMESIKVSGANVVDDAEGPHDSRLPRGVAVAPFDQTIDLSCEESVATHFGVKIDAHRLELSRPTNRGVARFPSKSRNWHVARFLLQGGLRGRALADFQANWNELGFKRNPSKKTVENIVSEINPMFAGIGLTVRRVGHNVPWAVKERIQGR